MKNNVITILLSVFAALLIACDSSSKNSGEGIESNAAPGGLTTASCLDFNASPGESPTVSVLDIMSYPVFDEFASNISTTADSGVQSDIISASALTTFSSEILEACNHELFAENGCDLSQVMVSENNILMIRNPSLDNGVLTFNVGEDTFSTITMTIYDANFGSGVLSQIENDGRTRTTTWSRDSDGTERQNTSFSNGTVQSFVEASDCSATITTNVFDLSGKSNSSTISYNSPNDEAFSLRYNYCVYSDGMPICSTSP